MKKLIAVLVVALIATSLFASFSVGVSAGFEQFNGKYVEGDEDSSAGCLGRKNALSVAANSSYDLSDDFYVFDSFTAMFGNDFQMRYFQNGEFEEWDSGKEFIHTDSYSLFAFKNRVGFAYNLPVESSVNFSVGASFVYGKGTIGYSYEEYEGDIKNYSLRLSNYGVGLNLKASYEIQEGFSAFIALDGDFAFKQEVMQVSERCKTIKVGEMMLVDAFSFSFGAKAGVMYTF